MLDKTFANSRPVLVVMEAVSHCILSIELADDRKAKTSAKHQALIYCSQADNPIVDMR